jgi:hypothetical protein
MLDTRKHLSKKAFTLFSGYLTLSIALFGVAAAIYRGHGLSFTVVSFVIIVLTLIAGAICFVFALMDEKYGAVASDPNMWLKVLGREFTTSHLTRPLMEPLWA